MLATLLVSSEDLEAATELASEAAEPAAEVAEEAAEPAAEVMLLTIEEASLRMEETPPATEDSIPVGLRMEEASPSMLEMEAEMS